MTTDNSDELSDLDWVQLRREMGTVQHVETSAEKFTRRFTANPFVPIGNKLLINRFTVHF